MKNPMTKPAAYLYRRFLAGSKTSAGSERVNEEVKALEGGRREAATDYQIKKLADVMLLTAALLVVSVVLLIVSLTGDRSVPEGRLVRDGYGGLSRSRELTAEVETEAGEALYTVTVGARKYSTSEAGALLEAARDELEAVMLGENESRDEVLSDLLLPDRLQDGRVSAEYLTVPYGMISEQGEIVGSPEKEGSLVEIRATLTCQEETLLYDTAVMVYPTPLPADASLRRDIEEALASADREQAESEFLTLPEQVGEVRINWKYPRNDGYRLALLWCVLLPPLVWFGRDAGVHRKAQERQMQLAMDHPDILWRLTMLLGAGMSVRTAFIRIVTGYQRSKRKTGRRYAYEEMAYTLREMDVGIGEAAAYERFGRRCGLPGFIKLGSLLAANVKKGSGDLRSLLEREASSAMEERKNLALQQGERAGTKMLFPMILMLGVVIAVLIVPAFLSMS